MTATPPVTSSMRTVSEPQRYASSVASPSRGHGGVDAVDDEDARQRRRSPARPPAWSWAAASDADAETQGPRPDQLGTNGPWQQRRPSPLAPTQERPSTSTPSWVPPPAGAAGRAGGTPGRAGPLRSASSAAHDGGLIADGRDRRLVGRAARRRRGRCLRPLTTWSRVHRARRPGYEPLLASASDAPEDRRSPR